MLLKGCKNRQVTANRLTNYDFMTRQYVKVIRTQIISSRKSKKTNDGYTFAVKHRQL